MADQQRYPRDCSLWDHRRVRHLDPCGARTGGRLHRRSCPASRSGRGGLYWCSLYGWEPGKDIEIISQGDATARIDAFKDPTISAILARPQYLSWGEKEGFRAL